MVTNLGLILTAVEEAKSELFKGSNIGHRNVKVITQRSTKIYKNLLKQYNTRSLLKNFNSWEATIYYQRKFHEKMGNNSSKKKIIEAIVLGSSKQITNIVNKKVAG